jgi:hypothetical protein
MHRFAARRLAWNLGLADDRLTKNFEVTREVLLQLITRAVVASDEILPRLGSRGRAVDHARAQAAATTRGLRCSGVGSTRVA